MELTFLPVRSFKEAIAALQHAAKRKTHYIDGIMFSAECGVIMTGVLKNTSKAPRHTYTKAADEWFYLHAEQIAKTGKERTVAVPIYDYLFRYDRGAFWMGRFGFERLKTPFNRLTRTLLNPLMHTRKMYEALQASGVAQECIIQDLALPSKNAVAFLEYIDQTFSIYPIWLCPLLPDADSPFLSSNLQAASVMNIGVWGKYNGNYQQFVTANKELEATLKDLGGKKWLYAQVFYDEPTFWKLYGGRRRYDMLRKKYHAGTLPTTYDKVRLREPQKISTKRGLFTALFSRNNTGKK